MLHKQHGSVLLKTFIFQGFCTVLQPFKDITQCEFEKDPQNRRVIDPPGKPMAPHLLCCQGFAVNYYSFTLDAWDLQHPRLLQR
jgi:hypothetical protein